MAGDELRRTEFLQRVAECVIDGLEAAISVHHNAIRNCKLLLAAQHQSLLSVSPIAPAASGPRPAYDVDVSHHAISSAQQSGEPGAIQNGVNPAAIGIADRSGLDSEIARCRATAEEADRFRTSLDRFIRANSSPSADKHAY